jgi:uroporphyrinogen-III synthase
MTGLVVITRPRDEANALSAELTSLGYKTLVEPMLHIMPVSTAMPPLNEYHALAFTSANGARIFAGRSDNRSMPVYAVGSRTADTLRELGFGDIRDAAGDADALAVLIANSLGSGGPILHLSGRDVARDLGGLLSAAGIACDRLMIYETIQPAELSEAFVAALYACTISDVLFFSTRTAAAFGTLIRKRGLTDMISSSIAHCLSGQVAVEAMSLPWQDVRIASHPSAAALKALLPPPSEIHAD